MIKNKILYATQKEAITIIKTKNNTFYIAEIDGIKIQTEKDYFQAIWLAFNFPPAVRPSWAGHDDWIRDMSWLDVDGFVLFIYNFSFFMKSDQKNKDYFIEHFKNFILPFWEDEVTRVFVGGKAKPFNIYLVD